MGLEIENDIAKIFSETCDEIRANMKSKGINASGRTSESIRVETYPRGIRLVGGYNSSHVVEDYPTVLGRLETSDTAPIPTLEIGRVGGAVPKGFYYIIREWTREKGLSFSSESERSTFSYFLSRKIARQGTRRSRMHADVYSTPVVTAKERIQKIINKKVTDTVRAALGGVSITSMRLNV